MLKLDEKSPLSLQKCNFKKRRYNVYLTGPVSNSNFDIMTAVNNLSKCEKFKFGTHPYGFKDIKPDGFWNP